MTPRPDTASPAARPGRAAEVGETDVLRAVLEVHGTLDLGRQLLLLAGHATRFSGAEAGLVLGPAEEATDRLVLVGGSGAAAELAPDQDVRVARVAVVERLAAALAPGLVAPFPELARVWPGDPPAALLALPVGRAGQPPLGLVLLGFDRAVSAETAAPALRLLHDAAPATENALRLMAMRELVIKDDTAHCYNRRHFETALPDELSRASRFNTPLSLIFLDMDNLKEVNTRHGHAAGSRTLCEVANRVRGKIRRFDKLFRFGGDEFCIVLPETQWHGALEVAERVRDAIARRPFLADEPGVEGGVRMTASLGIASYPLHAHDPGELIEQADRAMQRVKKSTKNSIGIAEIVGERHG